MPSTRPPSRTSQSRRRRLSSPAMRSTTSTIARCSPRSIRSSAEPRAGLGHRGRLERAGPPRARWRSPTAWPPRDGTTVRSMTLAGAGSATAGAARSGNQPPASAWIGIATRSGPRRAGRTSAGRRGRPAPAPPGWVTKASWDSVSDRRGSGIAGHRDPNLAAGSPGPEDHDEGRTGGGAEEEAEGQEGQLARSHAGFDPRVRRLPGRRRRGASVSCASGARQLVARAPPAATLRPRPAAWPGERVVD